MYWQQEVDLNTERTPSMEKIYTAYGAQIQRQLSMAMNQSMNGKQKKKKTKRMFKLKNHLP